MSYLSNAFHFDMDACLRDNDVYVEDIKNNDLIDKIKIVLANLCKNNDSKDIKIIKDALCPVVVVDMSMMHLALEKLASK